MVISTKIFSVGDSVVTVKNSTCVMVVTGIEKNLIYCSWKNEDGIPKRISSKGMSLRRKNSTTRKIL